MSTDELFRSLTDEQREAIAKVIADQEVRGEWDREDGDSVWRESAAMTLASVANLFRTYDPESAIN